MKNKLIVLSFNRPKAISCLATPWVWALVALLIVVSIARRRLVVLRRAATAAPNGPVAVFQSPEGD